MITESLVNVWIPMAVGFIAIGSVLYNFGQRMGKIGLQVDTMWGFLLRRAKVELLSVGWAEKMSPLQIKIETLEQFNHIIPFLPEVMMAYGKLMAQDPPPTEQEMFVAFENQFGDRIADAVCVPLKVTLGACVIALIEACRYHVAQDKK